MFITLWLDDARDPADNRWADLVQRPDNSILVWVKSFEEFVWWIEANGLPDHICFDHDINSDTFNGVDAAKYLTGYCLSKDLPLPSYSIQSANTIGRENIKSVLESFKRSKRI